MIKSTLRELFIKYLTQDSATKDARRREYNQALFDAKEGWAVFCGTDLNMILEKFDKAVKVSYEGGLGDVEDGIWCPRCGKVFHDKDMEEHPEEYFTCSECFAIQHEKCRGNLSNEGGYINER